jgi:hypothetical protein
MKSALEFRVSPLPRGQPDDIASAMDREKTDTLDISCPNCKVDRKFRCISRTVTAPEYLWVVNDLSAYDDKGVQYKNRNPIGIPEELDFTSHMIHGADSDPVLIRYGVQHVVYHAGNSLNFGHYTTAVTGMPQIGGNRKALPAKEFFCDDSKIDGFTNALMPAVADVGKLLTVNPVRISTPGDKRKKLTRTPFDPYILLYARLTHKRVTKRITGAATRAIIPVTGEIADCVKNHPRIRRKPAY